jgi:hypothetical protein
VNLKGEPAHVGKHCGSNSYEVDADGVAFYADALDDHHPLQEMHAPPLIFHSEQTVSKVSAFPVPSVSFSTRAIISVPSCSV